MTTGIFAGLWDVVSCSNKEKYICKKPAEGVQVTTVPPTTPALSCVTGWFPVVTGNYCFRVGGTSFTNLKKIFAIFTATIKSDPLCFFTHSKFFSRRGDLKKTWSEARDFCKAIGGDLISIHSGQDLQNAEYVTH